MWAVNSQDNGLGRRTGNKSRRNQRKVFSRHAVAPDCNPTQRGRQSHAFLHGHAEPRCTFSSLSASAATVNLED